MTSQYPFLLAFHRSMRLTKTRFQRLKSHFEGDFKRAWESPFEELQKAGIDAQGLVKIKKKRDQVDPTQEWDLLKENHIRCFVEGDDDYPLALEALHDPPPLLFIKGKLLPQDFPNLAVVGSRHITPYGKRALEHLITPVAQAGITITSGLAFGTDFLAHQTAVKNGGRTIAVLGGGLDHIYPAHHKKWVEQHLEADDLTLVSEWPPQTELIPEYFPLRNRIIAGLARALVVIEGTRKSGSLITARLANDQGKDIFALPGDIFSAPSQGPNQLILDGMAHPLTESQSLFDHFGLDQKPAREKAQKELPTFGIESDILKYFKGTSPIHVDELSRQSAIPLHRLTSTLILLEMKGLIQNIGQQQYVKNS